MSGWQFWRLWIKTSIMWFLAHTMWEGGSLGAHKTTFNSAYAGRDSIQNTQNGGKPRTTVLVRYWRRQKISMSLRVPTLVKDPVNTGLKTLFWMAWWLISRVGCHWSKTGSLVLYVLRLSIYTLVTCKLPWSVLLHTCVWSTRHGWGPCSMFILFRQDLLRLRGQAGVPDLRMA